MPALPATVPGAAAAARAIAAGELTSEALVRACLERIGAREEAVRAWAHLEPEAALAQARDRDAGRGDGPLRGVPVGVKDIIDTADMPTAYGSPIHAGHRPARDAACVAALRAAGAVVLGKTVTTEFALWTPPPPRNPHDLGRTPGGSSSGTAAAVADGMVPVALGSQTAGSVVRPASFCGVLGFKPTHGHLDLSGVRPLSAPLDTLGVLAREAEDLELLRAVLAGEPPRPLPPAGAPPAIGLLRTPWWERADADGRRAVECAAERLAAAGARVAEVDAPAGFGALVDAQDTLMAFDVARALAAEYEHDADRLSPPVREYVERGRRTPREAAQDALRAADAGRAALDPVLRAHDALLCPAVVGEAPPVELGTTGDPLFCRAWTLLGTPAVAVPGMTGSGGLPIGVQLVGRPGQDRALLAVAAWAAERLHEGAPAGASR